MQLFDRSATLPVLTDEGRALVDHARAVTGKMDVLRERARGLAGEIEPDQIKNALP